MSNQESIINALRLLPVIFFGGGILFIIASSKSWTPSPVLALTPIESEVSIPIISFIWFFTEFWSADWRSILLSTGNIYKSNSTAL